MYIEKPRFAVDGHIEKGFNNLCWKGLSPVSKLRFHSSKQKAGQPIGYICINHNRRGLLSSL